jgi:hypothetical protein
MRKQMDFGVTAYGGSSKYMLSPALILFSAKGF